MCLTTRAIRRLAETLLWMLPLLYSPAIALVERNPPGDVTTWEGRGSIDAGVKATKATGVFGSDVVFAVVPPAAAARTKLAATTALTMFYNVEKIQRILQRRVQQG